MRSWAPAFVFSTSSPAPVVRRATSFKYNLEHDTQRKHLLAIVDHLKTGLRAAGIPLVSADSHILPLRVGDPHRNKHISKVLLDEHDIYVQPVNAPTVPAGSERLRVTPTSAHSHADVETFRGAGTGLGGERSAEGRMKLADYNGHLVTLCLMATGTFAIGTDAFIVAGVLSDISDTLPSAPRKRGS